MRLTIFIIFFFGNIAFANADIKHEIIDGSFQDKHYLALNIQAPKDYKIYFKVTESGLPINIKTSEEDKSKIFWPVPVKSSINNLDNIFYSGKITIPIEVDLSLDKIQINYSFSACKEICIPIENSQTIYLKNISFNQNNELIEAALENAISDYNPDISINDVLIDNNQLIININSSRKLSSESLIIENDANHYFKNPTLYIEGDNYEFNYNIPENIKLKNINIICENIEKSHTINDDNIIYFIVIALIGGVLLNFMPCILPIISIKLLSIVKSDQNSVRKNTISTILGILVTFISFASITIFLRYSGETIGLGLYFQNYNFTIFICLMIVFFITNLQDRINIRLPSFIYKFVNSNFRSSFFEGMIVTLLATPCSTPFIGSAMSFALTQHPIYIITIFLFMGVGFALPYILMLKWPSIIKFIPKSGIWLNYFKIFLNILFIISLIWFIYIFSTQTSFIGGLLLFLICLIFKFCLEKNSKRFLISLPFIIACAFAIPKQAVEKFQLFDHFTNDIWQDFDENKIPELVNQGKIVIVNITASWCATCQYIDYSVFKKPSIVKFLHSTNIVAMKGDLTNPNIKLTRFINEHGRYGIPFVMIYSLDHPAGKILPEIFDSKFLINEINIINKKLTN